MTVATQAPADTRTRDIQALKALSHPARHRIVELIHERGGEICVCEFADHLDLSQPTISHHLRVLREAGLIDSRQEGTWVYHTIRRDTVVALAGRLAAWAQGPAADDDSVACCAQGGAPRDPEARRRG